jgi:hypothetical protein
MPAALVLASPGKSAEPTRASGRGLFQVEVATYQTAAVTTYSEEEWAGLVRGWFPELADTRLRQVTWPAIAEHHDYIVEQLKARVRVSTIHQ